MRSAILAERTSLGGDPFCFSHGATCPAAAIPACCLATFAKRPYPTCRLIPITCKADRRDHIAPCALQGRLLNCLTRADIHLAAESYLLPCRYHPRRGALPLPCGVLLWSPTLFLSLLPRDLHGAPIHISTAQGAFPPPKVSVTSRPSTSSHQGQGTSYGWRTPIRCNLPGSSAWSRRRRSYRSCYYCCS